MQRLSINSKLRVGVALAIGTLTLAGAGSAFADGLGDFSVGAVAACDTSTGTPKAAITVTDRDASGTPADISVVMRLADGASGPVVYGSVHIEHPTAAGVSRTILVDWIPGYSWNVHVVTATLNDVLAVNPRSGDAPCLVASTSPTVSATRTPTHTAAPTSSAPASASTSVRATASASPTGAALAATGGGSGTGPLTAIAGALVAVGIATVFAFRRRARTGRH